MDNKSGIDIIYRIIAIMQTSGILGLIKDGNVFAGNYNPDPEKGPIDEFFVVNTLPFQKLDVVGSAHANINLYISDKDGFTDFSRFSKVSSDTLGKLEEYETFKGSLTIKVRDIDDTYSDVVVDMTKEYFTIKVKFVHGPYKEDRENDVFKNHSLFNIRVNCNIENS